MNEIREIQKIIRGTDVKRKRALVVKKCARCSTRFLVKHSRQKFCNYLCLERAKAMRKKALSDRQKGERVCIKCGAKIESSKRVGAIYCTDHCRLAAFKERQSND